MANGGLHGQDYGPLTDRERLNQYADRMERLGKENQELYKRIGELEAENQRLNGVIDEIVKRK